MSKRLVLQNEYVELWFPPETRIVHHQFRKFIWGDAFRDVLNEGLRLFVLEGATKWLSDDRMNSALSKSDTEWSMSDWFPHALKVGWKHWGIVLPVSVIGQMNMSRMITGCSQQGLIVRAFEEPEAALEWLEGAV